MAQGLEPPSTAPAPHGADGPETLAELRRQLAQAENRLRRSEDRRKAMLHILGDYERDRQQLGAQAARLDGSRRALLHILQDVQASNLRLEQSRKAMIHIMGDLAYTTAQVSAREAELRTKQEQLLQAAKMATLGELTTGVAHELNNPLNNIALFVGNALDRLRALARPAPSLSEDLEHALQQVQKAAAIISHLRTFGRVAPVTFGPVDLRQVVAQALSLMREQLRVRQIDVEVAVDAVSGVEGSTIQLEQVFVNLLTNARDAVLDGDERSERRIRIRSEVPPDGDRVEVSVRDNGPGIPQGLEQRVFDPFFTTKDVGHGTGLGLSIVYSILQEHRGGIRAANHRDGGAEFLVWLPLAPTPTAPGGV